MGDGARLTEGVSGGYSDSIEKRSGRMAAGTTDLNVARDEYARREPQRAGKSGSPAAGATRKPPSRPGTWSPPDRDAGRTPLTVTASSARRRPTVSRGQGIERAAARSVPAEWVARAYDSARRPTKPGGTTGFEQSARPEHVLAAGFSFGRERAHASQENR